MNITAFLKRTFLGADGTDYHEDHGYVAGFLLDALEAAAGFGLIIGTAIVLCFAGRMIGIW